MIASSKTSQKKAYSVANIAKLISDQRQMLAHAACDKGIIEGFDDLLRFLRTATPDELNRVFLNSERQPIRPPEQPNFSDIKIAGMSASELMQIVGDDTIPRKILERIAIHRFGVPRGSMRSFSNRTTLTEKLLTLIRNEQAHTTIEAVARGHGGPEAHTEEPGAISEKKD